MMFMVIFNTIFAESLLRNVLVGLVPIIVLVVVVTVGIKIAERKRMEKARQDTHDMLAADDAANMARNRDICDRFFYTASLEKLPITEYSAADMAKPVPTYMWQAKVIKAAAKQMLHFDKQYTNVELKQMFGPANLDNVAKYEENFANYMHAMRFWAEALITANNKADAQRVLEESVSAGSELSQSYTLLADIYNESKQTGKLQELLAAAEASTMPGKGIATKHIGAILAGAGK